MNVIFEILGVIGAGIILLSFFSNQRGWLRSSGWRYALANLAGSGLILISLYMDWNLASVVIEGFWAAISFYGLCRAILAY